MTKKEMGRFSKACKVVCKKKEKRKSMKMWAYAVGSGFSPLPMITCIAPTRRALNSIFGRTINNVDIDFKKMERVTILQGWDK